MVRLERHPAAGDMLRGEADRRISELGRRGYEGLKGRRRWRALGGRWWNWLRSRGVGRRGGLVAAAVLLAAAAAESVRHETQVLVLLETHLRGRESQSQT